MELSSISHSFREILLGVRQKDYLTIAEAACWGISGRRIQQLRKNGTIEGARKKDRSRLVPATAKIPLHPRTEKLL